MEKDDSNNINPDMFNGMNEINAILKKIADKCRQEIENNKYVNYIDILDKTFDEIMQSERPVSFTKQERDQIREALNVIQPMPDFTGQNRFDRVHQMTNVTNPKLAFRIKAFGLDRFKTEFLDK